MRGRYVYRPNHPSIENIRELLDYDPITGAFRWRASGKIAGSAGGFKKKYLVISVMGCRFLAHRLAWLYINGSLPYSRIDHRDTNERNNAIANLRLATATQSVANRAVAKSNKLGVKGVKKFHNRYVARIRIDGKDVHLGTYADVDSAHSAYLAAASVNFGEFSRG